MAVALAVLGAALIVAGVGMISVPAAVVVAGAELVAAAYVVRFFEANGGTKR